MAKSCSDTVVGSLLVSSRRPPESISRDGVRYIASRRSSGS